MAEVGIAGEEAHPPSDTLRRVGFWLGLAAFATLLSLPVPASMKRAVSERFAAELGATSPAPEPSSNDGRHQTEDEGQPESRQVAVEARARVMLDTAAVTALMAIWWIFVALPIPVTSLVPLFLLPLVGALPLPVVARSYADRNVFLFMGGFILALAIERWGLHRRIALHVVGLVGTGRRRLVLGFMTASAVVSMWISNTATAMMLLPIGLAVCATLPAASGEDEKAHRNFATALMLAIAYGANMGGIATPIGTPPNIAFLGQYRQLYPQFPEISFLQWMIIWLPLVVVFIPITWIVLTRLTCPIGPSPAVSGREWIRRELRELGTMRSPETSVLIVFVATALLWMTRSIPVTDETNYGWASCLAGWLSSEESAGRFQADRIDDASIAIAVAVLLFIIPASHGENGKRRALMDWTTAQRLPWGILLLFGGGFAIAAGFEYSGLSYWFGRQLEGLDLKSPLLLVIATCTLLTFLTELTSNTATAQVMLPIVARLSSASGLHPLLLMLPATISASFAFMLPVGTPPNAIVFGSGHVPMKAMVRSGLILNFIGIALVTLAVFFLAAPVLKIE